LPSADDGDNSTADLVYVFLGLLFQLAKLEGQGVRSRALMIVTPDPRHTIRPTLDLIRHLADLSTALIMITTHKSPLLNPLDDRLEILRQHLDAIRHHGSPQEAKTA